MVTAYTGEEEVSGVIHELGGTKHALCFTGHRPDKLGGYSENPKMNWVRERLAGAIARAHVKGFTVYISGMALGVDQIAAEEVISLRQQITFQREAGEKLSTGPVVLVAAIPFEGQSSKWPERSQHHYECLLDEADEVVAVSGPGYSALKMQLRNEWMVEHSSVVVAVWDGTDGGTKNCIEYAKKLKRPIFVIDPIKRMEAWL